MPLAARVPKRRNNSQDFVDSTDNVVGNTNLASYGAATSLTEHFAALSAR
jgi:hypothetical protein